MKYQTVFEDSDILVIDKPAGVEVAELPFMPAHRLDKDTSGLLIIAKNESVLEKLQEQFKNRQVKKEYLALVLGDMKQATGELVTEIARDPSRRVPFKAVEVRSGFERGNPRVAKTTWQVVRKITPNSQSVTLLTVKIITGRTHQIRVHMKHLGYPLVGDMVYATKESKRFSKKIGLERQFLHASHIEFIHPTTGQKLTFDSGLPTDLQKIINE